MQIRPYTAADSEAVVTLWRAVMAVTYTFLEAHTEAEDRAYFARVIVAENELWVAEIDGRIAGYLALQGDFLDRLYIAVERQRQGVGSALLGHAKQLSPAGLRLFTHQKNTGACRFYEARGFEVFQYGVSPPPESEPDVEYHWWPAADG